MEKKWELKEHKMMREIYAELKKLGWIYQGFDRSNVCDLFINKEYDWCVKRVEISYYGIMAELVRLSSENMREGLTLRIDEATLFFKLLNLEFETRYTMPKDLAENQKQLDAWFDFECGGLM